MESRACGLLLHISSLPSPYGIGDIGPTARDFAAALSRGGIKYWQFLPLTPTSSFIGNSPYSSPSAFAGNPLFISPELLAEEGRISQNDLDCVYMCSPGCGPMNFLRVNSPRVDYELVEEQRKTMLTTAFERSLPELRTDRAFLDFCAEEACWLDDYAMFSAIKESRGCAWFDWPEPLKHREPSALAEFAAQHETEVLRHKFVQFLFFTQWRGFKSFCNDLGVSLIGDMPIYVTHDSADVWANQEMFKLDKNGQPVTVAGVPPDYFSKTGQRWGNPVYDWDRMKLDNFSWWKKRLAHSLAMVDLLRLDHFRGFCAYWEIPAEEETAINGVWTPAPGRELFTALRDEMGDLPVIAEDLGIITDDVRELMEDFALPGMKVLQFAFSGSPGSAPDLPFRHRRNSVVYSGTHDNATTLEWFESAPPEEVANLAAYLGMDISSHAGGQRAFTGERALDAVMRLTLSSVADLAVLPMQDILGMGAEGRMNTPSVPDGNFAWRLTDRAGWSTTAPDGLPDVFRRLHELCRVYGRV